MITISIVIQILFSGLQIEQSPLDKLDWLLGRWARSGNNESRQSFETWERVSADKFIGFGYTLKNGDTTFTEKLEIVEKNGELFYVADVSHNSDLVFFRFTQLSDTLFVCENPYHDFPKNIAYRRDGENLYAQIWDAKNRVDFSFVKAD